MLGENIGGMFCIFSDGDGYIIFSGCNNIVILV